MADESVATLTNLLRDARGPLVENLKWKNVLSAEVKREMGSEHFDGLRVKVPLITALKAGTGYGTEAGILNTPRPIEHGSVFIDTGIANHTVSFTSKAVLAASKVGDTGWIDVVPREMQMAEESLARTINESYNGAGDALVAAFTVGATSVTQTVGANANFYQLFYGRVVDILVRATGVTVSLGRKIVDFDEAAGTVEFDASFTTTTSDGIFLEGSYGNAIAGLGSATAITGTFQTVDKGTNPWWRGNDVSPAADQDLTIGLCDKAERRAATRSGSPPKFYLGDPAVIDRFSQGLTVQANWTGDKGKLDTGWDGITYLGRTFIKEYDAPAQTLFGVNPADIRIYTRDDGPDWDERDGMFKRFARALPFEAWLIWHVQMGFHRCASQIVIKKLVRAA